MLRFLKIALPLAVIGGIVWFALPKKGGKAPLEIPPNTDWQVVANSLPGQIEAAEEEGLPLTAADITPKPVPANENAATYYRQALQLFGALSAEQRNSMQQELDSSVRNRSRSVPTGSRAQTLAKIKPLLAQGASKATCDFGRDWTKAFNLEFPEFAHLKNLVKLLSAEAVILARSGQNDAAISQLRTAMRIAKHAESDPTLIATLVRIASDAIVARSMEIIASEAGDAGTLRKLQDLIPEFKPEPDLMRALGGELVMGRYAIQGLNSMAELEALSEGKPAAKTGSPGIPPALKQAWEARLISHWRRAFAMHREGGGKTPLQTGEMLDKLEAELQQHSADMTYIMNAILIPVVKQAGEAVMSDQARVRLLEAKIALLIHQSSKASLPADLSILGKFIDPFTDKPMIYVRSGSTFVVYSVGRDFQDNGGKHGTGTKGTDITVEHPLNPAKLPKRR